MTARNNRAVYLLLSLLLTPGLATADSADAWLERMNSALHSLSYEGRFVYQHGQTLDAMYLSHSVTDGHERERLISLTGLAREVVRDNEAVICIISGPESAQVDPRPSGRQLAPVHAIRPEQLSAYYHFELGGQQRVAGRAGQVVSIHANDDQRYSYWLLLDKEYALPLAAATLDKNGHRISQLLFTDLQVGTTGQAEPQSLVDNADVTRIVKPLADVQPKLQPRWSFQELPDGFIQTRYRRRLMGQDDHEVDHFIFNDGLATVSVYVEEERSPDAAETVAVSRLGAVTALSRAIPGYQITAVGEVPERSLKRFLDGIHAETAAP